MKTDNGSLALKSSQRSRVEDFYDALVVLANVYDRLLDLKDKIYACEQDKPVETMPSMIPSTVPSLADTLKDSPSKIRDLCSMMNEIIAELENLLS